MISTRQRRRHSRVLGPKPAAVEQGATVDRGTRPWYGAVVDPRPLSAPVLVLQGERAALGPLRRELISTYQKWDSDPELVTLRGSELRPRTLEAKETWFDEASKGGDAWFTIYETLLDRPLPRPIGLSRLFRVERIHRSAELGIYVGERDARNMGLGTEATRLTLDYAFNALGIHNVSLRVIATNTRAFKTYERVGFKAVGRLREYVRIGQRAYDVICMDCLATEFESPILDNVRRQALGG